MAQFRFVFITLLVAIGALQASEDKKNISIKAVIFDCDGTLVDNGIGYFLDWQYALQQQGYELDEEEFWDFMHKNGLVGKPGSDKEIVAHYCNVLGRSCSEELLQDKSAFSIQLHQTYAFPAIEPTVNFLRTLGKEKEQLHLKLGVASANHRENVLRVLKRLDIEKYLDVVVCYDDLAAYSDPEGVNKPKPYIYLHASKLLGFRPGECMAIEDSITGVTAATRAGCITVAIPNAATSHHDLSSAHIQLPSLVDATLTDVLQQIEEVQKAR